MWVASDVLVTCVCSRRRSQHQRRENRESPAIAGLHGRTRSPLNYYVPGRPGTSAQFGVTGKQPENLIIPVARIFATGHARRAEVIPWLPRRAVSSTTYTCRLPDARQSANLRHAPP